MEFPDSATPLKRQRLLAALSTPARLVALVGPTGSGATTLLRQWAMQHTHVTWAVPGTVPDDAGDVLILDDADELSEAEWSRLRTMRIARPQLLIRVAVHSRTAVPAEDGAEFVAGLSFTTQETGEYLSARNSSLDLSAVQLGTGGLPAAVRAVAHLKTLRHELVDAELAGLRPGALKSQHAALAIPEVLTREVVSELGGPADFIDESERNGLGEWIPDAGHPLFVLTAPVRAATLQVHATADGTSSVQLVREKSARVLLEQGAWYGALIEGAASDSLPVIDAALKGGGMTLLRTHGASIAASLRSIRVLELRRWPIIAFALALILNARHEHRMRAGELMGIALLGSRTAPAGTAERALLRVIESVGRRLLGIGDGGVRAAHAAAHILDELPAEEQRAFEGLLGDLHTHSAISLMYGGRREDALLQFERALGASKRPGTQLLSYGGIAMVHALSGDIVAAQAWVNTALTRSWPDSILNEYAGSLLRIAQAKIFLERGELDQAEAAIESIWHIIDTIEHWPALAHLRGTIDICRGRADEGRERMRALRRRRGSRMVRSQARLLDLSESSLALAAGDFAAARDIAARSGDLLIVAIGTARAEVFNGEYERALRMLGSVSSEAPEAPEARANMAVLEAIVLSRLGRGNEAAVAVRRARAIADTYGLTTPFLLIPSEDRELFGVAAPWEAATLEAGTAVPRLTERERVILGELLQTASVNDIATRLHVSANTVKSQRRTLYRKLGATSRDEAIAIAIGHGLTHDQRVRP